MNDVTLKDLSAGLREETAEIRRIADAALDAMSGIDGKYEDEKPESTESIYSGDVFGDLLSAKHDLRQATFLLIDLSERIRRATTKTALQGEMVAPDGMRIR